MLTCSISCAVKSTVKQHTGLVTENGVNLTLRKNSHLLKGTIATTCYALTYQHIQIPILDC